MTRPCTTAACDKPLYARGWCHAHYWQAHSEGRVVIAKPLTHALAECGTCGGGGLRPACAEWCWVQKHWRLGRRRKAAA